MKTNLIMTVILYIILVFFPLTALIDKNFNNETDNISEKAHTVTATSAITEKKQQKNNETVSVFLTEKGKEVEMSAEEYIYGTVCAEMPASFHKEALKAQAVASYTYMKWLKENADNSSYSADITDSPSQHQAFATEDELKKKWGDSYSIYSSKVKEAVKSVLYEYLTYNGETAMTVFHSLSPGKTSNASDIWKSSLPYLKSVTAPGDKLSPDFSSEINLNIKDFIVPFEGIKEEELMKIFDGIKTDKSGFVSEISLNNNLYSATDLRSSYNLKSPYFTVEKEKDVITLTVYGKGHGVGMSQYSADYMARQGSTYKEILAHFYSGTKLITD